MAVDRNEGRADEVGGGWVMPEVAPPGAELVELERGGHCASETSTQAFNDAVLGFIARHS